MGQEGVNVRRLLTASLCLAAGLALATPASAAPQVFSFQNTTLGASVTFTASGTTLNVHLVNTGGTLSSDVLIPANVLTNVLFNCTGCGTLAAVSATSSGATFVGSGIVLASGQNVGGEWALAGSAGSFQIASSGANGAGQANFNGGNLAGPTAVDGLQYGIVPAGDNTATGNPDILSTELTHDDVNFVLTCSVDCSNAVFSGVVFQYGTSADTEPSFGGTGPGGQNLVPEPTSLLLFGSGLAMTAYRARRKNRQPKKDS